MTLCSPVFGTELSGLQQQHRARDKLVLGMRHLPGQELERPSSLLSCAKSLMASPYLGCQLTLSLGHSTSACSCCIKETSSGERTATTMRCKFPQKLLGSSLLKNETRLFPVWAKLALSPRKRDEAKKQPLWPPCAMEQHPGPHPLKKLRQLLCSTQGHRCWGLRGRSTGERSAGEVLWGLSNACWQ